MKVIEFPCGHCGKECVDVESLKDSQFEDFSVGCDKCQNWFHYVCVGLKGDEPELRENSNLEYFCPKCKQENPKSSITQCQATKSKGKTGTRSQKQKEDTLKQPNEDSLNNSAVRRSSHTRKPVQRMDY